MSIPGDGTVEHDIKYVLCAQRVHLRNVINRPTAYFFKISKYKRGTFVLCNHALDNSGLFFLNYANIILIANVNFDDLNWKFLYICPFRCHDPCTHSYKMRKSS